MTGEAFSTLTEIVGMIEEEKTILVEIQSKIL
jgi:hypothetical protein